MNQKLAKKKKNFIAQKKLVDSTSICFMDYIKAIIFHTFYGYLSFAKYSQHSICVHKNFVVQLRRNKLRQMEWLVVSSVKSAHIRCDKKEGV